MHSTDVDTWLDWARGCPHEFSIQYPPRPEYFMERFAESAPVEKPLRATPVDLLYLHVPFCPTTCDFCLFATDADLRPERLERYVEALLGELRRYEWLPGRGVRCVDIGGGTPTALPAALLERLLAGALAHVRSTHPFPVSIETSAGLAAAHPERLVIARELGVGRISMGIQSFAEEVLDALGRHQSGAQARRAADKIHAAGFARFNVDLIFGLQRQTLEGWEADLRRVLELEPDSITVYDCIYRGVGHELANKGRQLPPLTVYGSMYDQAYELLGASGYSAPYGAVNFSRHSGETGTSPYFEGRLLDGKPYVGVGNYATTRVGDLWTFNARDVDDYIDRVETGTSTVAFAYRLPAQELQAKHMLYSLNFGFIDENRFAREHGSEPPTEMLEEALRRGWLQRSKSRWRVAEGQFESIHLLRSLLYTPEAQRWFRSWCGPHSREPR